MNVQFRLTPLKPSFGQILLPPCRKPSSLGFNEDQNQDTKEFKEDSMLTEPS